MKSRDDFDRPRDARLLALRWLEAAFDSRTKDEDAIDRDADRMLIEDRGLYTELTRGVARERGLLDAMTKAFSSKPPKGRVRDMVLISAYQILFLDRIPEYAVFSEVKRISKRFRINDFEQRFIHGILKKFVENKMKILERRSESLEYLSGGGLPRKDLDWAVLGAPSELYHEMTIVDSGTADIVAAEKRAIKAIIRMKEQVPLVGYAVHGMRTMSEYDSLKSEIAPYALFLDAKAVRNDRAIRVQSEASQFVSMETAKWLVERHSKPNETQTADVVRRKSIRVLDMCAGKGTKFLSTLTFFNHLKKQGMKANGIEWYLADASKYQLEHIREDVLPYVNKNWPELRVRIVHTDFSKPDFMKDFDDRPFDLVLLDAPCSGFGTISKHPQVLHGRAAAASKVAKEMSDLQKKLIDIAVANTNDNGDIFYSVCTLTKSETVDVVEHMKEKNGVPAQWTKAFWPGTAPSPDTEGFFTAFF